MAQALCIQGFEAPRISRQSSHESGKVVSSRIRSPLLRSSYSKYSFLSESKRAPGPWSGRKD